MKYRLAKIIVELFNEFVLIVQDFLRKDELLKHILESFLWKDEKVR